MFHQSKAALWGLSNFGLVPTPRVPRHVDTRVGPGWHRRFQPRGACDAAEDGETWTDHAGPFPEIPSHGSTGAFHDGLPPASMIGDVGRHMTRGVADHRGSVQDASSTLERRGSVQGAAGTQERLRSVRDAAGTLERRGSAQDASGTLERRGSAQDASGAIDRHNLVMDAEATSDNPFTVPGRGSPDRVQGTGRRLDGTRWLVDSPPSPEGLDRGTESRQDTHPRRSMNYDDPEWSGDLFALRRRGSNNNDNNDDDGDTVARIRLDRDNAEVDGPSSTATCRLDRWTWAVDNTHTATPEQQMQQRRSDEAWEMDQLSRGMQRVCGLAPHDDPGSGGARGTVHHDDASGQLYRCRLAWEMQHLQKLLDGRRRQDLAKRRLRDRIEVEQIDPRQDTSVQGLQWLQLCYQCSDWFKDKRSPDQIAFHDAIYQTCAPHIVGTNDYPRVRQQLLRRYGRTESNMAALIMTPRRWGKTTAVAMAMAAIMYTARGVNILVFSTGQDMSTVLMDKVRGYFLELPGAADRVCEDNKKSFLVTHAGTARGASRRQLRAAGKVNRMLARAATVKGNKGVSFDIAVLEEASRIDMNVLHEVIAPMMKVSNSVLIALSTHLGKDNYYTRLFESDHPATRRLFLRLRVELMCARCKRVGAEPQDCHHLDHQHPPWLLGSDAERVKLLMEGNQQMYAQEVLGVIMSDQRCIFRPEWIERLRHDTPWSSSRLSRCFLTTMIDPAGSGASYTAMCTVARLPDTADVVIVGLAEADPQDEQDTQGMVDSYFGLLMKDPILSRLEHVLCCESNYGGPVVANVYWRMCRANNDCLWEYRSGEGSGVVTNYSNKTAAALSAQYDLWKGNIHLMRDLVSLSSDPDEVGQVKGQFMEQMLRMHKVFTGRGRWTYTGKDRAGGRDDMAICFLFASYYSKLVAAKSESRRRYFLEQHEAVDGLDNPCGR